MYKNNSKKKKENERWMSFSIFFYHPDPILSLFSSRRMANEVNGVMMDIIIDWKRNLHSYNVNHLRMTWWKDHERYGRADDEGRIRLSDSDIEIAYDSSLIRSSWGGREGFNKSPLPKLEWNDNHPFTRKCHSRLSLSHPPAALRECYSLRIPDLAGEESCKKANSLIILLGNICRDECDRNNNETMTRKMESIPSRIAMHLL